jgi:transposase-like protein
MSAPRLSEYTKRQIVKAYGAGETISAIAKRYGVHESYPGALAKRKAVHRSASPAPNKAPKLPPLAQTLPIIKQARVLDLYHAGSDLDAIAASLHCTLSAAAHGLAEAVERERYEDTRLSP